MVNVIKHSIDFYIKNLELIFLFSVAFIIAFLIPVFASLPTFNDAGAIFIRTSSIFTNLNIVSTSVIIAALFFSLLFLSFAIVAINILVRHTRTHTKIKEEVIKGIEHYTSRVFIVLLLYSAIIILVNIATYGYGISGVATAIVGILLLPIFFYAPSAIVIDEHRVLPAIRSGVNFFFKRFDYVFVWLVIAILALTIFDFIFIVLTGTTISRYAMLIFNAFVILPFLVVLQSQMYMKRFAIMRH
ncbi:MAG: hypothetical protein M1385_01070 [Candidatus Marsarchaeota archaeon]|nr:hypothetical protein [Candidatus Marsarchaeota archaeon]